MIDCSGAQDAAAVQLGFREDMGSLSSLGADVAHELANLLTVVMGSLGQLGRQPLDKQGQEQLARAEWGTLHAAQLMRQVLSQAQGGDDEAEVGVVDLNAAVGRFAAAMGQRVDAQVQLAAELAPGRLPVRLDPGLLDLVLLNLVRNAADAMPDGGTVVLRTRRPRLDGLGDRLATEVSDTGTGMVPAVAGRAAEAVFTTKPHGKGTGLGLWMAHRFASTYGGKITIETVQGQGTTVHLALPYRGDAEPG